LGCFFTGATLDELNLENNEEMIEEQVRSCVDMTRVERKARQEVFGGLEEWFGQLNKQISVQEKEYKKLAKVKPENLRNYLRRQKKPLSNLLQDYSTAKMSYNEHIRELNAQDFFHGARGFF
jgi:hypothetical protein